jgi:hypothetical protein
LDTGRLLPGLADHRRYRFGENPLGQATVVANLADRGVSEALEELFSEDADWNRLLPDLSFEAIRPQQALSDFVTGLQSGTPTDETEVFTAATIQPKTSTVVYQADKYRPDAFKSILPKRTELIAFWKNPAEKVLVFILLRQDEINWARAKDKTHLIYDLYVSRGELLRVAEPIIVRSAEICKHVLKEKNLGKDAVQKVILVGGPTLAPYFRELLGSSLGIPLDHSVDPLTVVARGAAVFAGTQRFNGRAATPVAVGEYSIDLRHKPVGMDTPPTHN